MIFSQENREAFKAAKTCWICGEDFEPLEKKVRDHCHFTGRYRGAAHSRCNLQFQEPNFTPVFFHNLSGYDSHLFVRNLGKTPREITAIANNEEKYISFSKKISVGGFVNEKGEEKQIFHTIRFVDSYKFMGFPLENLIKNLSPEYFVCTKMVFGEKWEIKSRKGVYPYDFMDSLEKFEMTSLPEKEELFSMLHGKENSQEDYEFAQKVWEEFEINTIGEYHDLYLKSDVSTLTDGFEQFRKTCLKHYELDPAWYFTSPGLSWDALLKESKVKLELLSDPDMLLFFKNSTHGGISIISNRFGEANHKYLEEFYPERESKFFVYLDANNLYGWAMLNDLPVGDFAWMTESELKNWREIPCFLEVDL